VSTVSSYAPDQVTESTQPEFEIPRSLEYPEIPAWGLMERAARLMPGRLACHYNELEWSWEELDQDAMRAADMLRRLGIQPGDRVGILLPNCPEYIIALNGIWRAGGIAVAIKIGWQCCEIVVECEECTFADAKAPRTPATQQVTSQVAAKVTRWRESIGQRIERSERRKRCINVGNRVDSDRRGSFGRVECRNTN